LRCLSKVTPSSLTQSTSETDVPATSMEVRLESDWSCEMVPKQIASVYVGFKTIPL